MNIQAQGYTPPTAVSQPTQVHKQESSKRPEDMFVVAPSLETTGGITLDSFQSLMSDYSELDRVAKIIKEKQEAIKEVVKDGLETLGMVSTKTQYGTFSIVEESTSVGFDSKKLKEEIPVIYDMYKKTTTKKGYLKVTPKKAK